MEWSLGGGNESYDEFNNRSINLSIQLRSRLFSINPISVFCVLLGGTVVLT